MAHLPYTGEASLEASVGPMDSLAEVVLSLVETVGPLTCIDYLPPIDPRHWRDQLMLTLFAKEGTYGASPSWSNDLACTMADYDTQAAHEEWDDAVDDDEAQLHGQEYPTVQVITRQSVRWDYHESRCKPNTLAGLMGLALGDISTTQEGILLAWRHRLRPISSVSLPSISGQTRHAGGLQYLYTGIKGDGFTLEANGAYVGFRCPLIGSGYREASASGSFADAVSEDGLRWGDAKLYLLDTGSSPLSLATSPVQGETNLGEDAVDLSVRIRTWRLVYDNRLADEAGYRPSTGLYRGAFHPVRRRTTLTIELDCLSDTEELLLGHYLTQSRLACELNLDSGIAINGGTYRYGLVLIVPRLRFRRVTRQEREEFDTLALEGRVHADGTNPVLQAWVFNGQPTYLA
jgi:hypothetical protein